MKQQIDVEDVTEQEGLCYDLERAKAEGLYEEVRVWVGHTHPVAVHDSRTVDVVPPLDIDPSDTLMDFAHKLELGVNVGPDDKQVMVVCLEYHYGYGQVPK